MLNYLKIKVYSGRLQQNYLHKIKLLKNKKKPRIIHGNKKLNYLFNFFLFLCDFIPGCLD